MKGASASVNFSPCVLPAKGASASVNWGFLTSLPAKGASALVKGPLSEVFSAGFSAGFSSLGFTSSLLSVALFSAPWTTFLPAKGFSAAVRVGSAAWATVA